MLFAINGVKLKKSTHSRKLTSHSLIIPILFIVPIALPAETKIFTIWNESDYFNEELQTGTVLRTGNGLTDGNSTEKRYSESQQRQN